MASQPKPRPVTISSAAVVKLLDDLPRGNYDLLVRNADFRDRSDGLYDQLLVVDQMIMEGFLRPSLVPDPYAADDDAGADEDDDDDHDDDDDDEQVLGVFAAFIRPRRGSSASIHAYFAITATTIEWVPTGPNSSRRRPR